MPRPAAIRAYHGTTERSARSILKNGFKASRNEFDWLGDGVYFFQDAPMRAWVWAKARHGESAAVLEARVRLLDCIDLLDIAWWDVLKAAYDSFIADIEPVGGDLPKQTFGARRLDRQVINYAVGFLHERGIGIRSVRAVFIEGEPAYPNSGLYDRSHVQIAVRDSSVIEFVRMTMCEGST